MYFLASSRGATSKIKIIISLRETIFFHADLGRKKPLIFFFWSALFFRSAAADREPFFTLKEHLKALLFVFLMFKLNFYEKEQYDAPFSTYSTN